MMSRECVLPDCDNEFESDYDNAKYCPECRENRTMDMQAYRMMKTMNDWLHQKDYGWKMSFEEAKSLKRIRYRLNITDNRAWREKMLEEIEMVEGEPFHKLAKCSLRELKEEMKE